MFWPSDVKRAESGCNTAFMGLALTGVLLTVSGVGLGWGVIGEINALKEKDATKASEMVASPNPEVPGQVQFVDFTFVLARAKAFSPEEAERIFAQFKAANPTLDCSYDMADRGEDRVIRVHLTLPAERR